MGRITEPPQVILFCAILYRETEIMKSGLKVLEEKHGRIEKTFGPVDFDSYTGYYSKEMGRGLKKSYFVFEERINRECLPNIKLFTNKIEEENSSGSKRLINIDPGYISRDKIVLASTKDFFHRIYLFKGIYGETTLHYRRGRYRYFSWTYPDYRDRDVQKFLEGARAELVREIRKAGK